MEEDDDDDDDSGEPAATGPTFKPFSQEELNKFLYDYSSKHGKHPNSNSATKKVSNVYVDDPLNILEKTKEPPSAQDKSKSWHLINSQVHNHPYDDHTGWVTLEPVPWSSSHVQKWEPNQSSKPQDHWDQIETQPSNKPSYEYKPTPKPHWTNNQQSWNNNNNKPQWANSWDSQPDIITDGGPAGFPQHESHNSHWSSSQNHKPHNYPSEGNGQWVLLSSTKGYSYPNRNKAYQRSLTMTTNPTSTISSRRSVKLIVLPALNGTANTTTSHGGLLEVEKTFQTVEESQREHAAKMLKLEALHTSRRSSAAFKVYPLQGGDSKSNSKAVLAAVGAGMVPATMAMLLPMVFGRKKRNIHSETSNVSGNRNMPNMLVQNVL
ncbi:hypothetical protein AAG570_008484 [Ranatra chinensis]|uniref:Uncharacterized protein n=1 Tax=Ranatra chinensis TaxID=642074 RepID=A0ABD0YR08_9HEMI